MKIRIFLIMLAFGAVALAVAAVAFARSKGMLVSGTLGPKLREN